MVSSMNFVVGVSWSFTVPFAPITLETFGYFQVSFPAAKSLKNTLVKCWSEVTLSQEFPQKLWLQDRSSPSQLVYISAFRNRPVTFSFLVSTISIIVLIWVPSVFWLICKVCRNQKNLVNRSPLTAWSHKAIACRSSAHHGYTLALKWQIHLPVF